MMEQDQTDINDWLLSQSPTVIQNGIILSKEQAGPMYHIDKKTPDVFIPMYPRSAAASENNTVARITVSSSIIGCIIGYQRIEYDVLSYRDSKSKFLGGYQICEIQYTFCFKPNKKLVYDCELSSEHWLVNYNKQTSTYKPVNVGQLFVSNISYTNRSDKQNPDCEITVYLQSTKEDKMYITREQYVDKGFYILKLLWPGDKKSSEVDKILISQCDANEYMKAKKLNAALLSESAPNYNNW